MRDEPRGGPVRIDRSRFWLQVELIVMEMSRIVRLVGGESVHVERRDDGAHRHRTDRREELRAMEAQQVRRLVGAAPENTNQMLRYGEKGCATYGRNGVVCVEKKKKGPHSASSSTM